MLEQGIDPNYLLGLIRDEDELDEEERDMFDYKLIYDAGLLYHYNSCRVICYADYIPWENTMWVLVYRST